MVPGAFPGFDFGPGVRGETTQRLPKLLVQNYTQLPLHGSCCFLLKLYYLDIFILLLQICRRLYREISQPYYTIGIIHHTFYLLFRV